MREIDTKITIYLVNEKTIEIKKGWFVKEDFLKTMNDNNYHIQIDNYIIPKTSINYIKFEEIESEDN